MIAMPMLRNSNQVVAMVLGYLVFCALYLGSASVRLRSPLLLDPGALEAAIPFVSWSIWIYLSQFVLLAAAIVHARGNADRSRVFYAMLLATAIAAILFVTFPTQIERHVYQADNLTGLAWSVLYALDTPFNCFPSLHVALAALAGTVLWRRGWRVVALVWPSLIVASTLTTRQHIGWDVAGGLLLAVAAWMLTPRLIRYE
jgi:membrane-associated phospholipid phosphatase